MGVEGPAHLRQAGRTDLAPALVKGQASRIPVEAAPRHEPPRAEQYPEPIRSAPHPEPLRPEPLRPEPLRPEPRPVSVLKSGVIDEMAYTLFTDGSIEAQMPDGTMRFASIEELRRHLEQNG